MWRVTWKTDSLYRGVCYWFKLLAHFSSSPIKQWWKIINTHYVTTGWRSNLHVLWCTVCTNDWGCMWAHTTSKVGYLWRICMQIQTDAAFKQIKCQSLGIRWISNKFPLSPWPMLSLFLFSHLKPMHESVSVPVPLPCYSIKSPGLLLSEILAVSLLLLLPARAECHHVWTSALSDTPDIWRGARYWHTPGSLIFDAQIWRINLLSIERINRCLRYAGTFQTLPSFLVFVSHCLSY